MKVCFVLDRNDPDVTRLTVEVAGEEIQTYESLEEMGLPKGLALCPYAYVGKKDDNFHLVHTSKARRSVAVGDGSLAMLIKGCPRLLPDKLLSSEKGDIFCAAVAKQHPTLKTIGLSD